MSGHSKWANIKHRKGAQDAKKSNQFTKLAHVITVAAKTNTNLDIVIEAARVANMPKENIQRAIDKGTGKLTGAEINSYTYEVYAAGGIGIIVNILTDNKNRTLSEIKAILNKNNARLANAGAVSYLFDERGMITINLSKQDKPLDELEMAIIDSGAKDYEILEKLIYVYTDPRELSKIKTDLDNNKIKIESTKIEMCPKNYINVSSQNKNSIINLLNELENHDDVNEIYTNADL